MTENNGLMDLADMKVQMLNVYFTSIKGELHYLSYDGNPFAELLTIAVMPVPSLTWDTVTIVDASEKILHVFYPTYLSYEDITNEFMQAGNPQFIPCDTLIAFPPKTTITYSGVRSLYRQLLEGMTNAFTNTDILYSFHPNDAHARSVLAARSLHLYTQLLQYHRM